MINEMDILYMHYLVWSTSGNALIYYQYYQIIKVKDDNVVILPNFHHGLKLGELNVLFFLIPYRRAHGAKYGERAMSYRALNKIG